MLDSPKDTGPASILLTGATGYVGGRLLLALASRGHRVRCLARRPESLFSRVLKGTEVVLGDCLQRETLDAAMSGIHTAYYLVHSMAAGAEFEEKDRPAAGVRRIVTRWSDALSSGGVTRGRSAACGSAGGSESSPTISPGPGALPRRNGDAVRPARRLSNGWPAS